MVGDAGKADGAEVDGVEFLHLRDAVLRHHAAGLGIALAGPVEELPFDGEAVPAGDRLGRTLALGDHFLADAVAGNDGDAVLALGHAGLRHGWVEARPRTLGEFRDRTNGVEGKSGAVRVRLG